jgi:hypothetical protein
MFDLLCQKQTYVGVRYIFFSDYSCHNVLVQDGYDKRNQARDRQTKKRKNIDTCEGGTNETSTGRMKDLHL